MIQRIIAVNGFATFRIKTSDPTTWPTYTPTAIDGGFTGNTGAGLPDIFIWSSVDGADVTGSWDLFASGPTINADGEYEYLCAITNISEPGEFDIEVGVQVSGYYGTVPVGSVHVGPVPIDPGPLTEFQAYEISLLPTEVVFTLDGISTVFATDETNNPRWINNDAGPRTIEWDAAASIWKYFDIPGNVFTSYKLFGTHVWTQIVGGSDTPTITVLDKSFVTLEDGIATWGDSLRTKREVNILVTESDTTPVSGVKMVLALDADGLSLATGTLVTGMDGSVSFMMPPGTYHVFRYKAGWGFGTDPRTLVVVGGSGTQNATYADAAVLSGTIPAAGDVRVGVPVGSTTGTLSPTIVAPITKSGTPITRYRGEDCSAETGKPIQIVDPGTWVDITSSSLVATLVVWVPTVDASPLGGGRSEGATQLTVVGSLVISNPQTLQFVLTKTQTRALQVGQTYLANVQGVFLDGQEEILWSGNLVIQSAKYADEMP